MNTSLQERVYQGYSLTALACLPAPLAAWKKMKESEGG